MGNRQEYRLGLGSYDPRFGTGGLDLVGRFPSLRAGAITAKEPSWVRFANFVGQVVNLPPIVKSAFLKSNRSRKAS